MRCLHGSPRVARYPQTVSELAADAAPPIERGGSSDYRLLRKNLQGPYAAEAADNTSGSDAASRDRSLTVVLSML